MKSCDSSSFTPECFCLFVCLFLTAVTDYEGMRYSNVVAVSLMCIFKSKTETDKPVCYQHT